MAERKKSRIKKRKHFTLMYVPHTQKSLSKYKIPIWTTYFFVFLMLAISGTLIYYGNDYYKTLQEIERLQNVDNVNKVQSEKIEDLLEKTQSMEQKMKELNQLDLQVREMIGLESKVEDEDNESIDGEAYINNNNYERDKLVTLAFNDSKSISRGGESRNLRSLNNYNNIEVLDSIDEQLVYLKNNVNNEQEKLTTLKEDVEERLKYLNALPDKWPVQGRITSNYGYRGNPFGGSGREFHDGLDIAAPYGRTVVAAGDGKVIFSSYRYGYGLMVSISHGYGYISHYAHNSRTTVKVGDKVKKGEKIAEIGTTGRSTGPHVHFMIDQNGRRINPLKILK